MGRRPSDTISAFRPHLLCNTPPRITLTFPPGDQSGTIKIVRHSAISAILMLTSCNELSFAEQDLIVKNLQHLFVQSADTMAAFLEQGALEGLLNVLSTRLERRAELKGDTSYFIS